MLISSTTQSVFNPTGFFKVSFITPIIWLLFLCFGQLEQKSYTHVSEKINCTQHKVSLSFFFFLFLFSVNSLGCHPWLDRFLESNVLEGDGSIRVWLGQILQIWLFTVAQGGPLSAYTQATMNPIIALPFQWYISLSLSQIFICFLW